MAWFISPTSHAAQFGAAAVSRLHRRSDSRRHPKFHSSLHEFGSGADNVDDDLGKGLPFPVDTAERHQRWLLTWSPHSGVSFCGPTVTAEEDEQ